MMAEIFAIFVLMSAISAVILAISPSLVTILAELVSTLTLNDWLIRICSAISYFVKYLVPCYLQYQQYHKEILHPLRGQVPDSSSLQILVLFW